MRLFLVYSHMRKDYETLFQTLTPVIPPSGLQGSVLARLAWERRHAARRRLCAQGSLAVLSLAGSVPAVQYAVREFAATGFSQFFSLLFSDRGIVLTYWREFGLSLVESLPILGIVVVLVTAFALISSLSSAARNVRPALTPVHV